ncbi:hypothetical protein [Streptomyces xantholiticus]|uniref:hypothetical protein n=1 Tax=Streptomyces xantholiticus TaxID=68285 RepID=UPI001991D865|nr:hypothetical protein GCM10010381_05740 [Streptomyces xantholiticus]
MGRDRLAHQRPVVVRQQRGPHQRRLAQRPVRGADPYARRARTVARVVLGMVAGLAVSLVVASLTDSIAVLSVAALLAAVQKALCDAGRIGPPGNVIFTFVATAALFAPPSGSPRSPATSPSPWAPVPSRGWSPWAPP